MMIPARIGSSKEKGAKLKKGSEVFLWAHFSCGVNAPLLLSIIAVAITTWQPGRILQKLIKLYNSKL